MDEHCRGCIRYLKSCSGMAKAVCEKHQLRIPRTNADRIRSMTDEELAEAFTDVGVRTLRLHRIPVAEPVIEQAKEDWRDWLKQEADHD